VLRGVDLDVVAGQNLVLFGVSGSGKSVILKCIQGLVEPDDGSILIDGHETVGMGGDERDRLMRKIGVLFQHGALFDSLTVWENVTFGLRSGSAPLDKALSRAIAIDVIASCGLEPDIVDLAPAELSGGMRKRVALARAIAGEPEILLLDDPTAGLDPIMTTIIDQLIVRSLARLKATALTVTHDIASARRFADRVAMLADGRVVWSGPVGEIDRSGNEHLERFLRYSRPDAKPQTDADEDPTNAFRTVVGGNVA
jgi:phospholipid/cholesterol/gamma-HCH transport system ATP-binding protein